MQYAILQLQVKATVLEGGTWVPTQNGNFKI